MQIKLREVYLFLETAKIKNIFLSIDKEQVAILCEVMGKRFKFCWYKNVFICHQK